MTRVLVPVVLLVLTGACRRPRIPDGGKLRVTVQRIPRHQHASALPACAVVGELAVVDQRGTDLLGQQFVEHMQPGESTPVVSLNDPAPWLADVARGVGSESTLRFGRGAANLKLTLRMLNVNETFNGIMGAMYRSRVVFDAELNAAGRSLFTGTFDGDAEQYGADQSRENLLEALNQAAENALVRLYSDAEFRKAVCTGSPAGGATTL